MSARIRSKLHRRFGVAVAVLYALSVFGPHFAHASARPHLSTEHLAVSAADHAADMAHHHAAGAPHQHDAGHQPVTNGHHSNTDTSPTCCAQMILSVLPQQSVDLVLIGLSHSLRFPSPEAKLTGRGADRLDRPPNV